jgi:hypothetical protein
MNVVDTVIRRENNMTDNMDKYLTTKMLLEELNISRTTL